ncbi:hypothetical protein SK355_08255 [Candidatus Fukatsuia symbiotica]|uniref:Pilus assembly protein PilP n=2 Tax=Candidatus Fukatsuia TaxID=1927833 RepID=A0A2U8I6V4_9GAMM|nr:hypothetical protein [Candidatus Fukatsuia symbiotica]AWK14890.1 hypothetical protein CCS41_11045 [Candidatus Fukatsuia symbiotica]MEA9445236.1 hypothetical protein [Candidatus Fukatsuia symbiotica]
MNKTPIRLVVLILMMPSIGGTNDTIPIKDPFQPLPLTSCNQDIDHLKKWRLRGIVGRQGYHHGWALTPEGGWHKLVVGKLVLTNWRVSHIDQRQVEVRYEKTTPLCLTVRQILWSMLSGSNQ